LLTKLSVVLLTYELATSQVTFQPITLDLTTQSMNASISLVLAFSNGLSIFIQVTASIFLRIFLADHFIHTKANASTGLTHSNKSITAHLALVVFQYLANCSIIFSDSSSALYLVAECSPKLSIKFHSVSTLFISSAIPLENLDNKFNHSSLNTV